MVTGAPPLISPTLVPLRAGEAIDSVSYDDIRKRLILDACKWDPQVGDTETIGRFALMLSARTWRQLSALAEQLAAELMTAEQELLRRPDLHGLLGLPSGLRTVLRGADCLGATVSAARVLRFDFHWTDQGWKISEVNSDVPGGFSESSELPAMMARHYRGTRPTGHPGASWADAIAGSALSKNPVALLNAPGYMEDRQVLSYLERLLERRGFETLWTQPADIQWNDGYASVNVGSKHLSLSAIIRFYQAEWLNAQKNAELFVGGRTPVSNPGIAAITESKRFPLVWENLITTLPTWKQLLPETKDPRHAPWRTDGNWLVKSAFCNTGDTVAIRNLITQKQWKSVARAVWFSPKSWVAQRRFVSIAIPSPAGQIYPCIGVYTVNGHTAGAYGRYCKGPVIDYLSVDIAVLVENDLPDCI